MENQPLKVHGGKGAFRGKLAEWIISLMPPHKTYVETHAGGLSVMLRKPFLDVSEVANDLNFDLANFWRVLADDELFGELVLLLERIPFSRTFFDEAAELGDGMVLSAAKFFVRVRQSRQGLKKDFATLSTARLRRRMNEQVSAWLSSVEGLPDVHDRLRRVVVENTEANGLIRRLDTEETLFYIDPPYLKSTRSTFGEYGLFEMSFGDHWDLLQTLAGLKGSFLLSGYRSDLYDVFAEENGWERHEFPIVNNAASGSTKPKRIECLWTNYEVVI